jgi:hypothetical protein
MSRTARITAALAAAAAFSVPVAAHAADNRISVNTGSGWTHDAGEPLLDVTHIFPGWSQSRELQVRNDGTSAATLSMIVTNIDDAENGCNHPESFVDTTCGSDGGEPSGQLQLTVYVDPEDDGTFETEPVWSGTPADLSTAALLADEMDTDEALGLRVDASLPYESGNETQTDQVAFDLQLSLEGDTVVVEGARHTREPERGVVGTVVDHLPFTGSPTGRLAAGAGWLVGAGVLLTMLARRRRLRTA